MALHSKRAKLANCRTVSPGQLPQPNDRISHTASETTVASGMHDTVTVLRAINFQECTREICPTREHEGMESLDSLSRRCGTAAAQQGHDGRGEMRCRRKRSGTQTKGRGIGSLCQPSGARRFTRIGTLYHNRKLGVPTELCEDGD
ncbi:hypothetical protein RJZ56_007344 [Blastomyces dermatitidis]|uniref:Uncharacterized protein n=2 Tax=Blastomyces TaxID=229219 RepID=A0A179UNT7_BLAGS|nr:uncharacterized protein BDBG_05474 [Blastomyces gilchristii SLH14081]XP_045274947.1 uncharacterized protein BDCG_02781 [Blastomyces dermatitidis ER-3]EEQ87661.1 hypothetical protein BDCG_02781 [Blastomyces dermatitidis ER-3]OAT09756.1 hypothetical protein BDBG_05474 [Blastomyces gilchristii SLH14081]